MVNLILPYPPSTNTYWRKWHNHMVIGPAGKAFRQKVINIIAPMKLQPITGLVRMQIKVYADSNRKRDVDNNLKALLDALTHAKVWIDDYQVKAISMMSKVTSFTGAVQDLFNGECRTSTFDGMPELVSGKKDIAAAVQEGLDTYASMN